MEQRSRELVCWRIGYSGLIIELFSYLLACTSTLFYFRIAPVLSVTSILVVGICAITSFRSNKKSIGVVCELGYCMDEDCFTTFVSDANNTSLEIKNVGMLWRSSYCALINIECLEGARWKQWVFAAETSPDGYCRLLRVLR